MIAGLGHAASDRNPVSMGDRLLDVLEIVASGGGGIPLSQISARTGLPKSTVLRLARVLERRRYIREGPDSRYSVSEMSVVLAQYSLATSRLRALAMPFLVNLCMTFDATANLCVPMWPDAFYLERVIPPRLCAVLAPRGKVIPIHATAGGKAIAAYQSEPLVESILNRPLAAYTKATKTDAPALRAEFEEIRGRGWAFDRGELRPQVQCVAAPVRDKDGHVIASIGLTAVSEPSLDGEIHSRAVVDAGRNLSGLLGYT